MTYNPSAGGVTAGDKGDITVSGSGATWNIDAGVVTTAELGGDITAAGIALLNDATAGDQRTTLGLGTLATQSGTFSGTSSGTNTGDDAVNSLYSGLVTNATHTGEVTGATALTIAADAVTYAKMQNVSAASRLLGRGSAGGAGDVEELTVSTGLSLAATVLSAGTLDTIPAPVAAVSFNAQQATSFLIENRTDDTGCTQVGRLWLRTDLP